MANPVFVPKDERVPLVPPNLSKEEQFEKGWRYVTIPDSDIYDFPFDGIWINNDHFKPGKHLVPPEVADSLEERLTVWQREMIRLMRPGRDKRVKKQLEGQMRPGVSEDAETQG